MLNTALLLLDLGQRKEMMSGENGEGKGNEGRGEMRMGG